MFVSNRWGVEIAVCFYVRREMSNAAIALLLRLCFSRPGTNLSPKVQNQGLAIMMIVTAGLVILVGAYLTGKKGIAGSSKRDSSAHDGLP
jgi:hypothetical protein